MGRILREKSVEAAFAAAGSRSVSPAAEAAARIEQGGGVEAKALLASLAEAKAREALKEKGDHYAPAHEKMREYGDLYFGKGTSPLTDQEFDDLSLLLRIASGRPVKTGHRLSVTTRTDLQAGSAQDWPLLATWLDNKAHTIEEFNSWLDKQLKAIGVAPGEFEPMIGSKKYDGQSVTISYDVRGKVTAAVTRGEDGLGVDVTPMFAGENHFGGQLSFLPGAFGVKYELCMTWSQVDEMNEAYPGKDYKNPRNTVPGILRSDDRRDKRRFVILVPLDIDFAAASSLPRDERLEILEDLFSSFTGNGDNATPFEWTLLETREDALAFYEQLSESRLDSPLMLDGTVYEFFSERAVEALGGRQSRPDYAAALKFPYLTARTSAVSLDWDLGKSGKLTPVVNFEPVSLLGNTYKRTQIANMTRFDALKLAPGTPLLFELRGDILGWLDRSGEDPAGAVPFAEPEDCTYTYNREGQRVYAFVDAPLRGRVQRLLEKAGVQGIKESTLEKLVEAGLISRLSDIFKLTPGRVAKVPGLGEQSAVNICAAIDAKCKTGLHDWEVLAGIGIQGIGRSLSRRLLPHFSLAWLLQKAGEPEAHDSVVAQVSAVPDFGVERAMAVLKGLAHYQEDVEEVLSANTILASEAQAVAQTDGPKFKVVVTGDLVHWKDRTAFKDAIEGLGHKMTGSVTSKTDFLITNETTNTGKRKDAQRIIDAGSTALKIISEEEAHAILGVTPSPLPAASGPAEATAVSLEEL